LDEPTLEPRETSEAKLNEKTELRNQLIRWLIVFAVAGAILLAPVPAGITVQSWRLLAVFAATIAGSIARPIPAPAMVLVGVSAIAIFQILPIEQALGGYADPIVWMVLAAFFISRGMMKTGLGRRIAFIFIKSIGRHSLGLTYALASTDALLATVIPSTGARSGGIVFPIAKSLAEAYESRPGNTARRLGAFLMTSVYQCDVIVCAMFLTGQASNPLIAKFAQQVTGIEVTYARWILASIIPAVASLILVPFVIYKIYPPEIKHTPAASEFASKELRLMGPMKWPELIMLIVFGLVSLIWMKSSFNTIH